MALSRMAAMLLLASTSATDEPGKLTADQAIATYRETFSPIAEIDCPKGDPDEIVVCASRQRSQRLEASDRAEIAARVRGEPGSGAQALAADGCIQRCYQPVSINLLAIPGFIGKVVERLQDE